MGRKSFLLVTLVRVRSMAAHVQINTGGFSRELTNAQSTLLTRQCADPMEGPWRVAARDVFV